MLIQYNKRNNKFEHFSSVLIDDGCDRCRKLLKFNMLISTDWPKQNCSKLFSLHKIKRKALTHICYCSVIKKKRKTSRLRFTDDTHTANRDDIT